MAETIYITTSAFEPERQEEKEIAIANIYRRHHPQSEDSFRLTKNPEEASIILFAEHCHYKPPEYVDLLADEPLIKRYPERCFVHNFDDIPCMFLPGAYVSPVESLTRNQIHFPSVFLHNWNESVDENDHRRNETDFTSLASFTGTITAPCRESIRQVAEALDDPSVISVAISPQEQFFKHTPQLKQQYVDQLLSSPFALCPRGRGTMTYRLLDAMQFARCPIIIADDWIRPLGPDWDSFSLTIQEKEISKLPDILREKQEQAGELGQRARLAWEKHFSPGAALAHVVSGICEIRPNCQAEDRSRTAMQERHEEWLNYSRPKERFSKQLVKQSRQVLSKIYRGLIPR